MGARGKVAWFSIQARVEASRRTLVADTFKGQHPAPPECDEQFLARIASIMIKKLVGYKRGTTRSLSKSELPAGYNGTLCHSLFDDFINEKMITPLLKLFKSEPGESLWGKDTFNNTFVARPGGGLYRVS